MSDIKKGDQVRTNNGSTYTVCAVDEDTDLVWISHILEKNSVRVDQVLHKSILTRVKPKFEVGKLYTCADVTLRGHMEFPVTVVAVSDKWAIGWWADGDPWHRRMDEADTWIKIS